MAPLVRDEIILWRLISELFLGLLWAGPIVSDLQQITHDFWALQQIAFLWNDSMFSGPIVGCSILGFSCVAPLLAFLGSRQMVPTGPFYLP
jgi:hypothetical protein